MLTPHWRVQDASRDVAAKMALYNLRRFLSKCSVWIILLRALNHDLPGLGSASCGAANSLGARLVND